jgi:muramoyltetrapeptide carboxypeptidase LdcA involved in peptidoglycan recycling
MIPTLLKGGDDVRIIATSHSLPPDFTDEMKNQAIGGLEKLGLQVIFGNHVE